MTYPASIDTTTLRSLNSVPPLATEFYNYGFNVLAIRKNEKRPDGTWEPWITKRQTSADVHALPWSSPTQRFGVVSGIGQLRCADYDKCPWEVVVESLTEMGLHPYTYPWLEQSQSGTGYHVWFLCNDDTLPGLIESSGVTIGEPLTPGQFGQLELRWLGNQTVVAASADPSLWVNGKPDGPPAMVIGADVIRAFHTVATPKQSAKPTANDGGDIPSGVRESTLMSYAGTMRRRGMTEGEIRAAVREANKRCKPPLLDIDVVRIAKSVCRYDPTSPLLTLPQTDTGNGERFAAIFGTDMVYCPELGIWRLYKDGVWLEDKTLIVMRHGKEVARRTQIAAVNMPITDADRADTMKFALKLENDRAQKAMVNAARSELAVSLDIFDTNLEWLNVRNGIVNLRTGELMSHQPDFYFTRQAPVIYDSEAKLQAWDDFLVHITGGNTELAKFLQMAVGYSLTGLTDSEAVFFLHGPAATGKSTFTEAMQNVVGDYGMTADFETFLKRSFSGGPREDVARLEGARFVSSVEVEKGKKLAEGLIKQMTSDIIAARLLYKGTREFKPQMKLWLVANDAPQIDGDDTGIWQRIHLIPMNNVVPEDQRDPALKSLLTNPDIAGPAILAWAVEGAKAWFANGHKLIVPEIVKAATKQLRDDNDQVSQFVDDECEKDSEGVVIFSSLWFAYTKWCREHDQTPMRKNAFGPELDKRDFRAGRGAKGVRVRHGLWLQSAADQVAGVGEGDCLAKHVQNVG